MKANKYLYFYVLQGRYGFGWEDLCADENWIAVRNDLRAYEISEGGCYRIVKRREPNPNYQVA